MSDKDFKTWLPGMVLLLCCLAGGVVSTWALVVNLSAGVYDLKVDRIRSGEAAQDIAHSLSKTALATGVAELGREVSWLALSDLGPQVRQGCEGWLFLADELQPHVNAEQHAVHRARIVRHLSDEFAQRGIRLMVVVVPDKARVASGKLCSLNRPVSMATRLDDWVANLRAQGVVTSYSLAPDLEALADGAFLRTDTHWNEEGARLAAQAVARHLVALGFQADSPAQFEVQPGTLAPRLGDLVRLAGVERLPASLQPRIELASTSRVVEHSAGDDADLFGDAGLPTVALVGTSYSRTSNFLPWLEVSLKAKVGQFAKDGAEFAGSMSAYLKSAAFTQTPPRYLVWEIPERYIQPPVNAQELALEQLQWPPVGGLSLPSR